MEVIKSNLKRIVVTIFGWLLVLLGLAALVLPGPGLLMLFAGLALLSTQYEWADRRVRPVRKAALKTAAESVQSPVKIAFSSLVALGLAAFGILWVVGPPAPDWWPLSDRLWLIGGWGTGVTLIASALIALGMIIYSWFAFRTPKSKA